EGVARDHDGAANYLFQAMQRGGTVAIGEMKDNASAWPRAVLRGIQDRLRQRGFYQGKIDGSFGPQTNRAIDALVAAGQ
ncbi:MAG: peptidoglycan-binding domain-containing protein, partial [Alphaproteobacteria bacterium]